MVVVEISLNGEDYMTAQFPINFPADLKGELSEELFIQIVKIANNEYKESIYVPSIWLQILYFNPLEVCMKHIRERLFAWKIDRAAAHINQGLTDIRKQLAESNVCVRAKVTVIHRDVASDQQTQKMVDLKLEFLTGQDAKDELEISLNAHHPEA